jgi:hypothetical protein
MVLQFVVDGHTTCFGIYGHLQVWRWPYRPKRVVWPSTTNCKTIYIKAAWRRQPNLKSYSSSLFTTVLHFDSYMLRASETGSKWRTKRDSVRDAYFSVCNKYCSSDRKSICAYTRVTLRKEGVLPLLSFVQVRKLNSVWTQVTNRLCPDRTTFIFDLNLGCLHPVACVRSRREGFSVYATLIS